MPPAVIAAGVGAAASIGGGLLSSSAQKKAASQAAQAQQTSDAATIGLARDLYGQNSQNMRPFMQSGQRANRLLDSFLYGGSFQGGPDNAQIAPQAGMANIGAAGGTPSYGGVFQNNGGRGEPRSPNGTIYDVDRMNPLLPFSDEQAQFGGAGAYGMAPVEAPFHDQLTTQPQAAHPAGSTPAAQGQNPWDIFRGSTNYQFRLGEGLNALQQGYAGMGALQSGAALRGVNDYAQQFASNEFNNYLGLLQGQQALGAGSASALAGVGNDYLGSVTASNRNSADALSNAALLRGNANQNLYGGIAQGLGSLASSFKW